MAALHPDCLHDTEAVRARLNEIEASAIDHHLIYAIELSTPEVMALVRLARRGLLALPDPAYLPASDQQHLMVMLMVTPQPADGTDGLRVLRMNMSWPLPSGAFMPADLAEPYLAAGPGRDAVLAHIAALRADPSPGYLGIDRCKFIVLRGTMTVEQDWRAPYGYRVLGIEWDRLYQVKPQECEAAESDE